MTFQQLRIPLSACLVLLACYLSPVWGVAPVPPPPPMKKWIGNKQGSKLWSCSECWDPTGVPGMTDIALIDFANSKPNGNSELILDEKAGSNVQGITVQGTTPGKFTVRPVPLNVADFVVTSKTAVAPVLDMGTQKITGKITIESGSKLTFASGNLGAPTTVQTGGTLVIQTDTQKNVSAVITNMGTINIDTTPLSTLDEYSTRPLLSAETQAAPAQLDLKFLKGASLSNKGSVIFANGNILLESIDPLGALVGGAWSAAAAAIVEQQMPIRPDSVDISGTWQVQGSSTGSTWRNVKVESTGKLIVASQLYIEDITSDGDVTVEAASLWINGSTIHLGTLDLATGSANTIISSTPKAVPSIETLNSRANGFVNFATVGTDGTIKTINVYQKLALSGSAVKVGDLVFQTAPNFLPVLTISSPSTIFLHGTFTMHGPAQILLGDHIEKGASKLIFANQSTFTVDYPLNIVGNNGAQKPDSSMAIIDNSGSIVIAHKENASDKNPTTNFSFVTLGLPTVNLTKAIKEIVVERGTFRLVQSVVDQDAIVLKDNTTFSGDSSTLSLGEVASQTTVPSHITASITDLVMECGASCGKITGTPRGPFAFTVMPGNVGPAPVPAPSHHSPSPTPKSSSKKGVIIGWVVGILIGLIVGALVALLVAYLIERRRRAHYEVIPHPTANRV